MTYETINCIGKTIDKMQMDAPELGKLEKNERDTLVGILAGTADADGNLSDGSLDTSIDQAIAAGIDEDVAFVYLQGFWHNERKTK